LNREAGENILRKLKGRFTKELVLTVPDLYLKNEDESRCIRLYNRRGFVNGM